MANWDVFHADRLEVERGLEPAAIRRAFESGKLRDDDLVRPAGTKQSWARLGDMPELTGAASGSAGVAPSGTASSQAPAPQSATASQLSDYEVESDDFSAAPDESQATARAPDFVQLGAKSDVAFPIINDQPRAPEPTTRASNDAEPQPPGGWLWAEEVEEDDDDFDEEKADASPALAPTGAGGLEILEDESLDAVPVDDLDEDGNLANEPSRVALPVVDSRGWDDIPETPEEEEEGDLSLSRSGPATVEELDLAPMVDVAFQLVLFFMVTATTVLYKTLEIPKPSQEQAPTAVAQGRSLEDLQEDNILVEVDSSGTVKIDREPVNNTMDSIVETLRTSREKTGRKTMLLSADYGTKHRHCVLVIDAAHEIGMNIVIAKPAAPQAAAPSMLTSPATPTPPSAPP